MEQVAPTMGFEKPQQLPHLSPGEGAALGSIFRLQNHVQMSIPPLLPMGSLPPSPQSIPVLSPVPGLPFMLARC